MRIPTRTSWVVGWSRSLRPAPSGWFSSRAIPIWNTRPWPRQSTLPRGRPSIRLVFTPPRLRPANKKDMKSKLFLLGIIGLVLLSTTGCNKLKSRDRINKGIQSYKGARYADAVEFFKEAVELDPTNVNGRLYL